MARPTRRAGNLPAETTSFIGRRGVLAELRQKLSAARLVSLVGPGGVGKTRLAVRAATDLGRGFADGAWLVELAEVQDAALVSNAVMAAVDLRDQAATEPLALVLSYLRDKELLLVVDNCEHVIEAAAQLVTAVIKAAPGVRVVATSREPLSVSGEHVIPVTPLELPSTDGAEAADELRRNEAVMLFAERAAAAGPFELTPANEVGVAEVCRRLDGLPLAIELAAVRTRVLGVEQILERLTDRFGLLTGGSRAALPRHQTLRTTMEWSHDLLSEGERTLLRRLCVFAGRFTLEDVEAVGGVDGAPAAETLDLMSSLVDKSLVLKEVARGRACYRLHETMRDYAGLKLEEAGERGMVERRYDEYYTARCQRLSAGARYGLVEWLGWMDLEIDNVRSVLRRCVAQADFSRGLVVASAASWYWITRATTEGVRWLDELLASGEGAPAVHAWGYFLRGFLAVLKSDPATARQALERAIVAGRESGQRLPLAHSLAMAAVAANMVGDRESAKRFLDEAGVVAADLGDVSATVAVLQAQTLDSFFEGDLGAVKAASSEGARLSREAGDLYSLEHMLLNLGVAAMLGGDLGGARPLFEEALGIARAIDDRVVQSYLLNALACCVAGTGEPRLAAQLLGAAETMRAAAGASVNPLLEPLIVRVREAALGALGEATLEGEIRIGRGWSAEEAVGRALGQATRAAVPPGDGGMGLLAKREAEVARLVADGLTNKEIGVRLFISERTVDSHVRSVLNKLGFNSRAQIAGWISASNTP